MRIFNSTLLVISLLLAPCTITLAADKPVPQDENRTFFQRCTKRVLESLVLDLRVKVNSKGDPKLTVFDPSSGLGKFLNMIFPLFGKKLKFDELAQALYRLEKTANSGRPYFERLAEALQIKAVIHNDAWKNIPKDKPVIFYANHAVPGPDVFATVNEIAKIRPDVKVVGAIYLSGIPGLKDHAFFVNNMNTAAAKAYNKTVFPKINEHLKNGGSILIFPSGTVSKWHLPRTDYAKDTPWKTGLLKLAEQSEETVMVPMFVSGQPSQEYLRIREKNQSLSKAYSFRELADNIGKTLDVTSGEPIIYSKLKSMPEEERILMLRRLLYEKGEEYFKTLSPENYKELIEFASKQNLDP